MHAPHRHDPTLAQRPPERLDHQTRMVALQAANEARRRFPGAAGEILAREIQDFADFAFRTAPTSPVPRLIAELVGTTP